jgi:hypothetical protein
LALQSNSLLAVVADRFDRTTFHSFLAGLFFVSASRLLLYEGISPVSVAVEILRGGFAAQIAIDALIIDVEFARDVVCVFI